MIIFELQLFIVHDFVYIGLADRSPVFLANHCAGYGRRDIMSDGRIFFFPLLRKNLIYSLSIYAQWTFCPYKLNRSIHHLGVSGLSLFVFNTVYRKLFQFYANFNDYFVEHFLSVHYRWPGPSEDSRLQVPWAYHLPLNARKKRLISTMKHY